MYRVHSTYTYVPTSDKTYDVTWNAEINNRRGGVAPITHKNNNQFFFILCLLVPRTCTMYEVPGTSKSGAYMYYVHIIGTYIVLCSYVHMYMCGACMHAYAGVRGARAKNGTDAPTCVTTAHW